MKDKNIRKMEVTTESGKDVRDTQQLKGTAHQTAAWKAKNETQQYTTGAASKGSLGGHNTNS